MDLFNKKKIDALDKAISDLCKKVALITSDNEALKKIAYEQFKKSNKPKFKIGDNLTYTVIGHGYYKYSGIVYMIEPRLGYNGLILYYYHLSNGNNNFGSGFEPCLTKIKKGAINLPLP